MVENIMNQIIQNFFQGVILPQKFKIDKRKLHLSALILSNQISREEALEVLSPNLSRKSVGW